MAKEDMLNNTNGPQLEEIGDINVLRQILFSFSKATGLQAFIVNSQGEVFVTAEEEEKYCEFCRIVRSSEKGLFKCKRSYARAGLEASKYGKPYIFRCHAGLIAWAAPILIEDRYMGAIVCGQVLAWEPEDFFWEEIEEMTRGLGVDVNQLIQCAKKLEVLSGERIQAAADLLFVVANHIMKTGMLTLQQRRAISEQQARLGEEIQARKKLEMALKRLDNITVRGYSLDKERELVSQVRKGDREGAQKLLNEILADILKGYSGKISEVKARVLELLVVISRAAVEGGASLKKLLSLNSQYVEEFINFQTVEDLCHWMEGVTLTYVSCVNENKGMRNAQVIKKATEYIRNNYRRKITLEDVAKAVYLSPCHLSKIFKQELGCTIMEFLTKVRIEEAKKLLRNPQYNVIQVADDLGFKDPGYFTKVFKRSEGITPSQYREKAF